MRKTNIIYKCIYAESRKILQMNLLKSRNRDTDGYMDTKMGKGEWDQLENWIHTYEILCIKLITDESLLCRKLLNAWWSQRRDICKYIADAFCCLAETNIVKQLQ